MSSPWIEDVDSDQFHRDIEWDLGRTDYTPATDPYVAPWERDSWGASDVVITPPRNPGGYVRPERPLIKEGQRDYVFMPTEKGARRERRAQAKEMAELRGRDWREERLPRSAPKEPKERIYGDWREAEIPERRADSSSDPWDGTVYAGGGSPIEGVSGHDYVNDPKYREHRETRRPRKPSLRDTLIGAMRRKWR